MIFLIRRGDVAKMWWGSSWVLGPTLPINFPCPLYTAGNSIGSEKRRGDVKVI